MLLINFLIIKLTIISTACNLRVQPNHTLSNNIKAQIIICKVCSIHKHSGASPNSLWLLLTINKTLRKWTEENQAKCRTNRQITATQSTWTSRQSRSSDPEVLVSKHASLLMRTLRLRFRSNWSHHWWAYRDQAHLKVGWVCKPRVRGAGQTKRKRACCANA